MTLSIAQGFIGAGDVYLQPFLAGGGMGKMVKVGNTTSLKIKPNADIKQQISKQRDTYGNPLETFALQKPADVGGVIETLNLANLRYAFMGEDAAYAQTGATVTAEATIAALDGWVQLANEEVSSFVLKKGATVLTLGTTYELNARLGLYRVLSTNGQSVADADPLTADYVSATFVGKAIRGNVNPIIRAFLLLDGLNKVDNSLGFLRVWQAFLTSQAEFDWFSEDFNTIELGGTCVIPEGKSEAFKFYAR